MFGKDLDGTRLFPDKDPNKWNKAVAALEEFIKFADEEVPFEAALWLLLLVLRPNS